MITEYHAKLFARELSRRHSIADAEKLAGALMDAQVDLNPHRIGRRWMFKQGVVDDWVRSVGAADKSDSPNSKRDGE